MTEPSHFDDSTRAKLDEECKRLDIIQQRWFQEGYRLKQASEQAMNTANKAQEARAAIQKLLEVGKMELPNK